MEQRAEPAHLEFELTVARPSAITPISFGELYSAEFTPLVRLATLLVGNVEVARDIVQDAFVNLHVKWHSVREPHAYVRRSVMNGAATYHRRSRFRKTVSVRDVEQTLAASVRPDGGSREVTTAATFDHTLVTLQALSARQRAVVVLKFYEQCTEAEIATTIGCRPGSVGPTIRRALDILRTHQSPSQNDRGTRT